MLNTDQIHMDSKAKDKLFEVLCWATEALPNSENLWQAKLNFLFSTNQENLATKTFNKVIHFLSLL